MSAFLANADIKIDQPLLQEVCGDPNVQSIHVDLEAAIHVAIIIIIIMKIIYIAPNPLKGSRRFTKSVTATLQFT